MSDIRSSPLPALAVSLPIAYSSSGIDTVRIPSPEIVRKFVTFINDMDSFGEKWREGSPYRSLQCSFERFGCIDNEYFWTTLTGTTWPSVVLASLITVS